MNNRLPDDPVPQPAEEQIAGTETVCAPTTSKVPFKVFTPDQMIGALQDCARAKEGGRLEMLGELDSRLRRDYINTALPFPERAIKNITIAPDVFRQLMESACQKVLGKIVEQEGGPDNLAIVYPWRAGLGFLRGAVNLGIQDHGHIGISRDHEDHRIIHEYLGLTDDFLAKARDKQIILADPMLASASSLDHIIGILKQRGIVPEQLISASMISAPEGVQRLLRHPGLRLVTHTLDSHLDKDAYIQPGLGDAGDKYCEGLIANYFLSFGRQAFSDIEWATLETKLACAA